MTLTAYASLAFTLSILLTVQLVESQYVPKTCQCPKMEKRVRGPFSDFKVTLKGPNCLQDEIIVTRQKNSLVCLSPNGPQGKRLLTCWQRMQINGKDSKKCLRQKKQKQRRKNKKQVKPRKVKS
ncbi:uncharacterized protein LOC122356105 [Puntigrus tetrazona]|uniref:uncharacterized protein LOC122356105 n=1 Tax=Puntigrus tetrazona TaxID=1606681 RepID=UPI001C898518|nr:uncharacterized protein LOC122356105 [Puntigrus tetrazona]